MSINSIDDYSTIDLPTLMKYVINTTKTDGIYYSGHSLGCMSLFAMLDQFPEFNKNVMQTDQL